MVSSEEFVKRLAGYYLEFFKELRANVAKYRIGLFKKDACSIGERNMKKCILILVLVIGFELWAQESAQRGKENIFFMEIPMGIIYVPCQPYIP